MRKSNQLEELFNCLFLRNVLFHADLLLVERNLPASSSDITIIGICHLTRTIDNTAHNADFQADQILGGSFDAGDGLLEVIEGTSAAWA